MTEKLKLALGIIAVIVGSILTACGIVGIIIENIR